MECDDSKIFGASELPAGRRANLLSNPIVCPNRR
jgi:hypothetical protein